MGGELINTGHSVEWRAARDSVMVNITGGPLSYVYTVTHARLHFGERDQQGSEHLLDNRAFPAEVSWTLKALRFRSYVSLYLLSNVYRLGT